MARVILTLHLYGSWSLYPVGAVFSKCVADHQLYRIHQWQKAASPIEEVTYVLALPAVTVPYPLLWTNTTLTSEYVAMRPRKALARITHAPSPEEPNNLISRETDIEASRDWDIAHVLAYSWLWIRAALLTSLQLERG